MPDKLRPCWFNCYPPDDKKFLEDKELFEIDAMEDSIAPLNDETKALRSLITRFELCYHEADKEAEYIIKSIATGRCLEQSKERPPERKKELENTRRILSMWCENPAIKSIGIDVSSIPAEKLFSFIGKASPLKIWQVERIIDRVNQALDPNFTYHNLVLDIGDYGEPGAKSAGEHYKDNSAFLNQTRETIIHDTVDGEKSRVSLAYAIDLLMPCHWDFVGALVIILKAIGGDVNPDRPLACCARNIALSPLCDRMKIISDTLGIYWRGKKTGKTIDRDILEVLADATPVKRWLAASFDKTMRLHLSLPFDIELV
jgi:hypothetical protein